MRLTVSRGCYDEVRRRLLESGCEHLVRDGFVSMHGLRLVADVPDSARFEGQCRVAVRGTGPLDEDDWRWVCEDSRPIAFSDEYSAVVAANGLARFAPGFRFVVVRERDMKWELPS